MTYHDRYLRNFDQIGSLLPAWQGCQHRDIVLTSIFGTQYIAHTAVSSNVKPGYLVAIIQR